MGTYDEIVLESGVFVAFDLETTGLDAKKDRIVEIGAVKFDKQGLMARFSTLINPGIPMPEEAGRVNNITDEMLRDQPSLDEVFPDFIRFIKNTVLVAHNAPFDCGFINEQLKDRFVASRKQEAQRGLLEGIDDEAGKTGNRWAAPFPVLPNPVVNTLIYAKEVFPGRSKYKLQELAAFFNITTFDAHRAEDDARVCMELFIRCVQNRELKKI
ncbi:MAG: 3'-5' exonuclease [Treponema sp.]|jgi:DNA polymerase-3 subunit epsilon|nr:3'-5' exonuclease [Treponema sp.]